MKCPYCEAETSAESSSNVSTCNNCGAVLDEGPIVSEVSFQETATGQSSVMGQFVPVSGSRSFGSGHHVGGMTRDSKEQTLNSARDTIKRIIAQLSMPARMYDVALLYFRMAVEANFIQGRKTDAVVAACMYVACRKENRPVMLIDLSDALDVNVYALGNTFKRFIKIADTDITVIDPALYIRKFAGLLSFGDKKEAVSNCALRLVARMKRDWLAEGRRPSSICGAALLLAARLHGFRRTQAEIVRVTKNCDVTLRKRLYEFKNTPSAALSYNDFSAALDEDESALDAPLPPAFNSAPTEEIQEQVLKAVSDAEASGLLQASSEDLDSLDRMPAVDETDVDADPEMINKGKPVSAAVAAVLGEQPFGGLRVPAQAARLIPANTPASLIPAAIAATLMLDKTGDKTEASTAPPFVEIDYGVPTNRRHSTAEQNRMEEEERVKRGQPVPEDPLSDLDDDELDAYILSDRDAKMKERIWLSEHKDYLIEQREKALQDAEARKANGGRPVSKRRRGPTAGRGRGVDGVDGALAINKIPTKKTSSKLNYDNLQAAMDLGPSSSAVAASAARAEAATNGGFRVPARAVANLADLAGTTGNSRLRSTRSASQR